MKSVKPLTLEERKHIEKGLREGKPYKAICVPLGRNEQTIYIEIKKSGLTRATYNAEKAQEAANHRKLRMITNKQRPFIPTDAQLSTIKTCMEQGKTKKDIRDALGISYHRLQTYLRNNYVEYKSIYESVHSPIDRRISALEMQVEILVELAKKLTQRS